MEGDMNFLFKIIGIVSLGLTVFVWVTYFITR